MDLQCTSIADCEEFNFSLILFLTFNILSILLIIFYVFEVLEIISPAQRSEFLIILFITDKAMEIKQDNIITLETLMPYRPYMNEEQLERYGDYILHIHPVRC